MSFAASHSLEPSIPMVDKLGYHSVTRDIMRYDPHHAAHLHQDSALPSKIQSLPASSDINPPLPMVDELGYLSANRDRVRYDPHYTPSPLQDLAAQSFQFQGVLDKLGYLSAN